MFQLSSGDGDHRVTKPPRAFDHEGTKTFHNEGRRRAVEESGQRPGTASRKEVEGRGQELQIDGAS